MISGRQPGATFPLLPGHEIAGRIDAIGDSVQGFAPGERVAVGWFGGNCGYCVPCREGDFIYCTRLQVPGLSYPGGYADAVVVPATALARIPEEFTAPDAAPMGCAGVTVFNALRTSAARPGDLVAILGIGGLGHLGVQFAARLGFETIAIARGADKEPLAKQLGAHHYIDNQAQDTAAALRAPRRGQGGARHRDQQRGHDRHARRAHPPRRADRHRRQPRAIPGQPVRTDRRAQDLFHASGTSRDTEETLRFAALTGIRPMIEQAPLADAQPAYERMLTGQARFRMVLVTTH